jgi:hypothetical protein
VLLGHLVEEAAHLLEGCRPPAAVVGVDPEVDPARRRRRIGDPVSDRRLNGDVLEVGRTAVEGSGCSRSSIGISLSAAVSGRNQNAWPTPSC